MIDEVIDERKYVIIYDIEAYPDYFCIGTSEYFRPNSDSKYRKVKGGTFIWTIDESKEFDQYRKDTQDALWLAFNNAGYDDLMIIRYLDDNILKRTTDADMRALNDIIIKGNPISLNNNHIAPPHLFYVTGGKLRISNKNRRELWQPKVADLMLMSGEGSLKMKSIILEADSIMESPFSFNENVGNRRDEVNKYLLTDLKQTFLLYESLENEFKVRDQFYKDMPEIAYGVNSPKLADEYFKMNTKCIESAKINYSGKSLKAIDLLANKNISFENKILKDFFAKFSSGKLIIPSDFAKTKAHFDFDVESMNEDSGEITTGSIIDLCIPQHQFQFGTGGLHSINKNGMWKCNTDEIIYNVDVKSYYPSMIESYGINPAHVPTYSSQMSKILSDRFKVQKLSKETCLKEYKVEEQALKLLMNASFGKLNDKYSYLYDQKAMFTVTITGQILLLKYIDMLIKSGVNYELVNANTDGIFIKILKSDIDKIDSISRAWEVISKVRLDSEFFTAWYQYSVNEYYAVQDTGYIKTKGTRCMFKPDISKKMPVSKIVKVAVFEYVYNGIDPMETLKKCDKINDFLMSANSSDFESGGKEIGYKAIRVAYSNSGTPFMALKHDHVNGGFKKSVVLDGEKLIFIKTLSDVPVDLADINYDRYCWDVWKNIYTLIKPRNDNDDRYFMPAKEPEYHWRHIKMAIEKLTGGVIGEWYDYLKSLGLSIIPKNICKVNYKGVRTKMPETWNIVDPKNCLGLGVVMDTHCSIDIDNPDALDPVLKEILENNPTMKVWHGKDRVLNGGKGAFIYRGNPLLKSSSSMVNLHGFEWFNDPCKLQMVMGVHPKSEFYKIEGEPIDLPDELLQYLMDLKINGKRAISRITGFTKEPKPYTGVKLDPDEVYNILFNSGITITRSKVSDDEKSIEYWDDNKHWFVVSRRAGKYVVKSNHSNFLGEIEPLFK